MLEASSRDRRHQRYLISVCELQVFIEKPDIFVVDIDIEKAAELPLLSRRCGFSSGKRLLRKSSSSSTVEAEHSKQWRPSVWRRKADGIEIFTLIVRLLREW